MADLTLQLIRDKESYRPTAYWDVTAWRIGYGSDTMTLADGSVVPVKKTSTTTRAAAERDLARRVPEFQKGIIRQVGQAAWDKLPAPARAAVTSVAYNYGSLSKLPSLRRAIKSGDVKRVSSAIAARAVDNGGINSSRRKEEAALALTGVPSPTPATRSAKVAATQAITDPTQHRQTPTGRPITASAADAIARVPPSGGGLTTRRVTTVAIDANGTPIIRTPLAASVTPLTFKPAASGSAAKPPVALPRPVPQGPEGRGRVRQVVRKPGGVIKTAGGISGTVQLPAGVRPSVTVPGKLVVPQGPQGRRPGAAATLYPHDAPRVASGLASVPTGTVLNPGSRDSVRNAAAGRVAAATLSTIARQKAEAAAAARQRAAEAARQRAAAETPRRGPMLPARRPSGPLRRELRYWRR